MTVGFPLGDIAQALQVELRGDPALTVTRIGPLDSATPSTLSFLASPRYRSQLATTAAGAVIVAPALRDEALARGAVLVADDPYLCFARLTQWWARQTRPPPPPSIHPSAVIDPTAMLGQGVSVGPLTVVEAGAVLGDGVVLGAQCFVGARATLGEGTRFASRVTFNADCHIGPRGLLHSGAVIGADGFGFAPVRSAELPGGRWEKIEQLGGVRIGADVEIGANTCIDRGALDDTLIGNGVKLDNLIQIGHNVRIGDHTAIAGNAGVAGSAVIGAHCTIGGAANILGHLTLADHVHISVASVVMRSIRKPGQYSGIFPIDDNAAWEKNAATLRQLHSLRDRLRALEKNNSSGTTGQNTP